MLILINTLDLSVHSQPDGLSSSPIVVDVWVEVDFETARMKAFLGLVDTQTPCWQVFSLTMIIQNSSSHIWISVLLFSPPLWPSSGVTSWAICLSPGSGPLFPLHTAPSIPCQCQPLTCPSGFLVACVSPWAWEDVALHAVHFHCPHSVFLLEGA